MIKKIKDEIEYYARDFWRVTLGSAFTFKFEMPGGKNDGKLSSEKKKILGVIKEFMGTSGAKEEEKDKEISSKQRALNNAFYATIGQVIFALIFWPSFFSDIQAGSLFSVLFVADGFFYTILGFLVSKNRWWAGALLLIWFCIDRLLPGLIHLFANFTPSGVFYFVLFNCFFGQFYYKAFRYLRK